MLAQHEGFMALAVFILSPKAVTPENAFALLSGDPLDDRGPGRNHAGNDPAARQRDDVQRYCQPLRDASRRRLLPDPTLQTKGGAKG